mmetsp:Transcript_162/g.462  ORF Transcript_162/g.462 Transcript_162/m.462 type:complete len:229 (-) Transcript_162:702-1388(-)
MAGGEWTSRLELGGEEGVVLLLSAPRKVLDPEVVRHSAVGASEGDQLQRVHQQRPIFVVVAHAHLDGFALEDGTFHGLDGLTFRARALQEAAVLANHLVGGVARLHTEMVIAEHDRRISGAPDAGDAQSTRRPGGQVLHDPPRLRVEAVQRAVVEGRRGQHRSLERPLDRVCSAGVQQPLDSGPQSREPGPHPLGRRMESVAHELRHEPGAVFVEEAVGAVDVGHRAP